MKKIFFITLLLVIGGLAFAAKPEVNQKTVAAFEFIFKEATEVIWYAEETNDHVYFKINNIKTKIRYDKEGNFISCLRMYTELDLPMLVQIRLKENYANKKVTAATELATESTTEYYINVEDEKFIYILKADVQGSFTVYKKLRKG